jgi:hypothetical protein
MRSNLGWWPAPHWAAMSYLAPLSTCASTGASYQLCFGWDRGKVLSYCSDLSHNYKRYCNLECVLMRSSLGWPPAPHWTTKSYLALSTCASNGASYQLCFVWDSSKSKSTGLDHSHNYKRYCNLECVLMRSNLGWPPAAHWAVISYLALST